MTIGEGL
jgi:hypothetical protein